MCRRSTKRKTRCWYLQGFCALGYFTRALCFSPSHLPWFWRDRRLPRQPGLRHAARPQASRPGPLCQVPAANKEKQPKLCCELPHSGLLLLHPSAPQTVSPGLLVGAGTIGPAFGLRCGQVQEQPCSQAPTSRSYIRDHRLWTTSSPFFVKNTPNFLHICKSKPRNDRKFNLLPYKQRN